MINRFVDWWINRGASSYIRIDQIERKLSECRKSEAERWKDLMADEIAHLNSKHLVELQIVEASLRAEINRLEQMLIENRETKKSVELAAINNKKVSKQLMGNIIDFKVYNKRVMEAVGEIQGHLDSLEHRCIETSKKIDER